jgi:UDP-glucose 4-epimerase
MVTGGAGYIGAHVVRALLASGREVFVIDDLSTGVASRLPDGVEQLTGSVTDSAFLTSAMRPIEPTGVVHLAGKKSPTDSITDPLLFARENVGGVISLLEAVRRTGVTRVVFSSSARSTAPQSRARLSKTPRSCRRARMAIRSSMASVC